MVGLSFVPLPILASPTRRRKAGSFQVDYSEIVGDLERELRHLGATQVILSTGHDLADIRDDGWPYFSARKPAHPGVELQVLSRFGPLTFASDSYDIWQNNLLAIARSLEQLRAINARGSMAEGQPYRAYRSGDFGGGPDGETRDASGIGRAESKRYDERRRALLVLIREAGQTLTNPELQTALRTEDAWRDLYRQAVLRAHPDTGGSAERFRAVIAAMELLRDTGNP